MQMENWPVRKFVTSIGTISISVGCGAYLLLLIISTATKESFQDYNYEDISNKGISLNAVVTKKRIHQNTRIGEEGIPVSIYYEYSLNAQTNTDGMKTVLAKGKTDLKKGSAVKIKELNGETMITSLIPFTAIDIGPFVALPLVFGPFGIILILVGRTFDKNKLMFREGEFPFS